MGGVEGGGSRGHNHEYLVASSIIECEGTDRTLSISKDIDNIDGYVERKQNTEYINKQ